MGISRNLKWSTRGGQHNILSMKWYMNSIIYEIKWSYDLRSCERNICNCLEKPEKFRTSTGFEPVTSRYRCDALTNWATKPLTLGAGHLWVVMFPWGMNQRWNDIWIGSYMNCRYHFIVDSFLTGTLQPTKWPAPNVSGFVAQLDRASHRYREVTGSNPVEVLQFSGFSTQLQKLRSKLRRS